MLRLLFPITLFLFTLPLTILAEGDDFLSLSLEELLKIEIASYVEPHTQKQPASITVVSGEQLRLSGSRLLTHALTLYVPGYFFVDDQDDMIAGFRGLAPDNNAKVMVLVNGVNMNIDWFWGALLGAFTHHGTGIEVNILYADQIKDLYNFWFDRDRFQERLVSIDVQHNASINKNVSLSNTIFFSRDDFSLFTNKGKRTKNLCE